MHWKLPPPQGLPTVLQDGPEAQDGPSEASQDACKKPACKASHHQLLHIEGCREQQGREGLWADLGSGTRERTRPETTAALRTSQQVKGANLRCRVPK
jgi:hypothetical protein